jgi:hypothetical protein
MDEWVNYRLVNLWADRLIDGWMDGWMDDQATYRQVNICVDR